MLGAHSMERIITLLERSKGFGTHSKGKIVTQKGMNSLLDLNWVVNTCIYKNV